VHAELARVLAALVPDLGAATGEPVALDGGITNRNFRITLAQAGDVVVRLPGKDTELLGIDREAERAATAAAAATGVGPRVVAFRTEPPCLVTAFIPGAPIPPEALRDRLEELAASLRAVHAGPPLRARFDPFAIVDAYRATAVARGTPVPPQFGRLVTGARRIREVLTGPEHAPVACHNDLLNANFIHDGERVRIVDWEYAGMGDRFFDLGNLSVNNGFADGDDEALLAAYFGEPCTDRRFAALRLMRIMSDFREGMWGVVQRGISELDFDFAAYADEHLTRVGAALEDPRFETWLEAARGDRP
jgi:thiamine kinase-like enzyme